MEAMSPSAGESRAKSCCPASVSVTLRVVRVSSLTPSLASSRRIASLSDVAEMPRCAAAFRKLRISATAANASRSASGNRLIVRFFVQPIND